MALSELYKVGHVAIFFGVIAGFVMSDDVRWFDLSARLLELHAALHMPLQAGKYADRQSGFGLRKVNVRPTRQRKMRPKAVVIRLP